MNAKSLVMLLGGVLSGWPFAAAYAQDREEPIKLRSPADAQKEIEKLEKEQKELEKELEMLEKKEKVANLNVEVQIKKAEEDNKADKRQLESEIAGIAESQGGSYNKKTGKVEIEGKNAEERRNRAVAELKPVTASWAQSLERLEARKKELEESRRKTMADIDKKRSDIASKQAANGKLLKMLQEFVGKLNAASEKERPGIIGEFFDNNTRKGVVIVGERKGSLGSKEYVPVGSEEDGKKIVDFMNDDENDGVKFEKSAQKKYSKTNADPPPPPPSKERE